MQRTTDNDFTHASRRPRKAFLRSVSLRAHSAETAPVALFSLCLAMAASYIDKLALILVRERKQLVARSRGKAAFFTPGGKREGAESDEDALVRECREELTIDIMRDTIKPYGVFEAQAHGKPEGTMVRMTCFTADFAGELQASEEVEELKWIASDFPENQLSVTGLMILKDLKSKDLID